MFCQESQQVREAVDCWNFVFLEEGETLHTYEIDLRQFIEGDGCISLSNIFMHFCEKGLQTQQRKFYSPQIQVIIQPNSFCSINQDDLTETHFFFKIYPLSMDNDKIIAQNHSLASEGSSLLLDNFPHPPQCYLKFDMEDESQNLGKIFSQFQRKNSINFHNNSEVERDPQSFDYFSKDILQNKIEIFEHEQKTDCQRVTVSKKKTKKSGKKGKNQLDENKRIRQPERGIGQVIYLLKVWRGLHDYHKWSLIEAAKLLQVSKKSLDDYYLVAREGEIHGFDFQSHLGRKMGELRKFIKEKVEQKQGKLHHKLASFNLIPEIDFDKLIQQQANGVQLTNDP